MIEAWNMYVQCLQSVMVNLIAPTAAILTPAAVLVIVIFAPIVWFNRKKKS